MDEEVFNDDFFGISSHVSSGNMLEAKGFAEDEKAEQTALGFFRVMGLDISGEGCEWSQKWRIEIVLLWKYASWEQVKLKVVHLLLIEQSKQFGRFELLLIC